MNFVLCSIHRTTFVSPIVDFFIPFGFLLPLAYKMWIRIKEETSKENALHLHFFYVNEP